MQAEKSSKRAAVGKPEKPHAGFPLFPHVTGRWARKVKGRLHYFGRWGVKRGVNIVPVEDVDASAAAALAEFNRQWPYLQAGRTPPPADAPAGSTMRDVCNAFLTEKTHAVESGELSAHSLSEYHRTCERLIAHFGRERRVDDLSPEDFRGFRARLAKGCNVVTLKSKINRVRVVLKYAHDNRMIDRAVEYGSAFDRPKPLALRRARNEAGPRLFDRAELLLMLDALEGKPVAVEGEDEPVILTPAPALRAMVLLGLNGGLGNTDVANLPRSAVDLSRGWITFPRVKTGIQRRIPLWPETTSALTAALAIRPAAKDPADAGLCFLTERGTRFMRVQASQSTAGRHVAINPLSRRFEMLLKRLKLDGRRGRGFYTLRHCFETFAGESRDQVAVDAVMGHVDSTMAGQYRETISDERLRAVVEVVRAWLWQNKGGDVA